MSLPESAQPLLASEAGHWHGRRRLAGARLGISLVWPPGLVSGHLSQPGHCLGQRPGSPESSRAFKFSRVARVDPGPASGRLPVTRSESARRAGPGFVLGPSRPSQPVPCLTSGSRSLPHLGAISRSRATQTQAPLRTVQPFQATGSYPGSPARPPARPPKQAGSSRS